MDTAGMSQNVYETIRSLELAHQRVFDADEIKTIIKNYHIMSKM